MKYREFIDKKTNHNGVSSIGVQNNCVAGSIPESWSSDKWFELETLSNLVTLILCYFQIDFPPPK